jgi:hypothetical protein
MPGLAERGVHFAASVSQVGGPWAKAALRQVSEHTGIPVVLVAAIALVMSYRAAKRMLRFAIEVGFALVVVVALTELGWIRF